MGKYMIRAAYLAKHRQCLGFGRRSCWHAVRCRGKLCHGDLHAHGHARSIGWSRARPTSASQIQCALQSTILEEQGERQLRIPLGRRSPRLWRNSGRLLCTGHGALVQRQRPASTVRSSRQCARRNLRRGDQFRDTASFRIRWRDDYVFRQQEVAASFKARLLGYKSSPTG